METAVCARTGTDAGPLAYASLRRLVHTRTGFDLEPYKDRFIERRLAIRVRATHHANLADYLRYLKQDQGEMERLLRCLTIHVSSFFRNPSTFEAIRRVVLPQLFHAGAPRQRRFWSVGCARGEEPYSLAILACEHLGERRRDWDVRIHAVDIDQQVLAQAKAGEYGWPQVAGLTQAQRERWFVHDEHWRVAPEIRRLVRFSRSDILLDPPAEEYDFILCRNLLIYFDRPSQEAVLERFARGLRPGGYLVLGRTEVFVGAGRGAFEAVDPGERIYRRLGAGAPAPAGGQAAAAAAPGERP